MIVGIGTKENLGFPIDTFLQLAINKNQFSMENQFLFIVFKAKENFLTVPSRGQPAPKIFFRDLFGMTEVECN